MEWVAVSYVVGFTVVLGWGLVVEWLSSLGGEK